MTEPLLEMLAHLKTKVFHFVSVSVSVGHQFSVLGELPRDLAECDVSIPGDGDGGVVRLDGEHPRLLHVGPVSPADCCLHKLTQAQRKDKTDNYLSQVTAR